MQPYLFPYLGYFQLISAVDEFIIYDDVQYIVGGWINRNNLLINGEKRLFTFPVIHASPHRLINELEIDDNFVKFDKMLTNAYARAPYLTQVMELIRGIVAYQDHNLSKFIGNSVIEVSKYLGIETPILFSSDIPKDNDLKAQEKVIEICKKRNANEYINSIGGQELYSKESFEAQDLTLHFIQPHLAEYKQFKHDFVPGLSIIDVMMFNSSETMSGLLQDYELV